MQSLWYLLCRNNTKLGVLTRTYVPNKVNSQLSINKYVFKKTHFLKHKYFSSFEMLSQCTIKFQLTTKNTYNTLT